jgi:hypothetical protein
MSAEHGNDESKFREVIADPILTTQQTKQVFRVAKFWD